MCCVHSYGGTIVKFDPLVSLQCREGVSACRYKSDNIQVNRLQNEGDFWWEGKTEGSRVNGNNDLFQATDGAYGSRHQTVQPYPRACELMIPILVHDVL